MCFIRIPFVDSRVGYPYFQMFLDLSSFISSYLALRIECGFSLRLNGGMMTAVNDFALKSFQFSSCDYIWTIKLTIPYENFFTESVNFKISES